MQGRSSGARERVSGMESGWRWKREGSGQGWGSRGVALWLARWPPKAGLAASLL